MLKGDVSKTVKLFDAGRFGLVEKEAFLILPNGKRVNVTRQGLSTGQAVSIIPYFHSSENSEWIAVLVSQYRPMVNEVCLEAPGSLIDSGLSPEEQMVKVVKEETNIIIPQNCIRLVGAKWVANCFADQKVWLGTIEISVADINNFKNSLSGRTDPESELEVNEVVLYPLAYLLKHLDMMVSYTLTSYQILELSSYLNSR